MRNEQQRALRIAEIEDIGLATRGRTLAQIVQANLRRARDHKPQIVLLLVVVPRLDHAWVGDRKVRLTKAREKRVILAQHLHEGAAIVEVDS